MRTSWHRLEGAAPPEPDRGLPGSPVTWRPVEFDRAAQILAGVPYMAPLQGRRIYDHIREAKPQKVLELGTAHGASAGYIAAALAANAEGSLTTVDSERADYASPTPVEVLARLGLADRVELVRVPDSSYTWFLRDQIGARSDEAGNCRPLYDFCFLDGAHNWTIDGLSAFLVEKLLRPGGWLLLDDLDWTYASYEDVYGVAAGAKMHPFSDRERREPHVRSVWELIVKQHPAFTQFQEDDDGWGWAKKAPDRPRTLELRTTRPVYARVARRVRSTARRARPMSR